MQPGPILATPTRSISAHPGRSSCQLRQSGDLQTMHSLTALHRWWGVAFCLLFAMWFASGIVMHFVPFPARSEAGGGGSAGGNRGTGSAQDALGLAGALARSRGLDGSRATV